VQDGTTKRLIDRIGGRAGHALFLEKRAQSHD
jgi:hypothetical protein